MAENKIVGFLKIVLIIYAVVYLVYRTGYLLVPDFLVNLSGGQPVFNSWQLWSGGVLIALGIGSILVYSNPQHLGIFVNTMVSKTSDKVDAKPVPYDFHNLMKYN